MPKILCNRKNCKHNTNENCILSQIGIVDGLCVTFRRVKGKERVDLSEPFKANCQKSGGKYRSNRITGILK